MLGELDYLVINYIVVNIFASVILMIILVANHNIADNGPASMFFTRGTFSLILYFGVDTVWLLLKNGILLRSHWKTVWINVLLILILSLGSYFFFSYIIEKEQVACLLRWPHWLKKSPVFLSIAITLILGIAVPDQLVAKGRVVTSLGAFAYLLSPGLYIVILMIVAFQGTRKRGPNYFLALGFSPVIMVISGGVEFMGINLPLFCLSITTYLVYSYTSLTINKVALDSLTGLHRRDYFEGRVKKLIAKDEQNAYLLMVDVNNLKQANDNYGHLQGDQVLQIVGHALQKVATKYKNITCRYGGDEFLLLWNLKGFQTIAGIKNEIRQEISILAHEANSVIKPQVAIGSSRLQNTLAESIAMTDQKLYAEKIAMKSQL